MSSIWSCSRTRNVPEVHGHRTEEDPRCRFSLHVDDTLVSRTIQSGHLRNLKEVFQHLERHGIRLKKQKCTFLAESVEYLGHHSDHEGIRAQPNKIEAIINAPAPTSVHQLKFIEHYSSTQHSAASKTLLEVDSGEC